MKGEINKFNCRHVWIRICTAGLLIHLIQRQMQLGKFEGTGIYNFYLNWLKMY
jgi:hypothetical protein